MVQQMADSKFSGHGLPCNETSLAIQNNQPTLPATAKKIPLRDLQNEIRITGPISTESCLFQKERGLIVETSEACGAKRSAPECLVSLPHLPSPTTNAANGHLVYIRRRPDVEPTKSSISDDTSNITDIPVGERTFGSQDEIAGQKFHTMEPKVCVREVAPIARASLTCFSSGKLLASPSANSNLHPISSSLPPLDNLKKMYGRPWEERYCRLQDLLKVLDQSNQQDFVQMLRSLSSVELGRCAIELEKRSIQLSLEEAREIQRVRLFDVLGKYPTFSRSPFAQQGQLEN